jgi:hypothetical protein
VWSSIIPVSKANPEIGLIPDSSDYSFMKNVFTLPPTSSIIIDHYTTLTPKKLDAWKSARKHFVDKLNAQDGP